jgi:hypothetical protein
MLSLLQLQPVRTDTLRLVIHNGPDRIHRLQLGVS